MPQQTLYVPPVTLKEQIYTKLFDDILQGKYVSGQIITEKSLVDIFKVSKSPVREALIELCNEGVLRSIPRYGYEVIRLTDQDVQNVREFRLVLECGTLSNYWERIDTRQMDILAHKTHLSKDIFEKNALEHWQRNSEFHLELISCFNNHYIFGHLQQALRVQTRAYAQFYWDRWHSTVFTTTAGRHNQIIDSILAGDKNNALQFLEEDIAEFPTDDTVSFTNNFHSSL